MTFDKKLSDNKAIRVSIPLGLEFVFIAVLSVLLHQSDVEVQRLLRSRDILSKANNLSKSFYDAGVALGGYRMTKSPLFTDRFDKLSRQITEDLAELKTSVGDNPRQQQILKNLSVITETGFKVLDEEKQQIDNNQDEREQFRARHMYKGIRGITDRLQEEVSGLTEDVQHVAKQSSETYDSVRSMIKCCLLAGIALNVFLAFTVAKHCRNVLPGEK